MPERSLITPLGPITVVSNATAITALDWRRGAKDTSDLLDLAAQQLTDYFNGTLTEFTLPLAPQGSYLVQQVCRAMSAIPHGDTRTYGALAKELNAPAQAIGQACGANPIPVIIPCHRVLGTNGLGGFSAKGGVETKVWLLRHEKAGGLLI